MSTDVIILILVLIGCYFIFKRLNRDKSNKYTSVPTSNNISYTARKAIDHQRQRKLAADKVTASSRLSAPSQPLKVPDELLNFSLLTPDDLSNQLSAEIDLMLNEFSNPHPMLVQLATRSFEQKELAELIKTDPEITAKILTVVNSARYGLQQPIKEINHAIIFLGVVQVKNIALQFAMQPQLPMNDELQAQAYHKIWSASFLASQLALLLAKSLGKENASELSTLCLLLYLGDLVLLSAKPQLAEQYLTKQSFFQRLNHIQQITSTNSAVVGFSLANAWKLPTSIAEDIRYQYSPLVNGVKKLALDNEQSKDLILCYIVCRLSEMVVFEQQSDLSTLFTLDVKQSEHLEFFYLTQIISAERLEQINNELHANHFMVKAQELIARTLAK
ncbi:HDOD domain-containing protein [Colwellia sp. MEBiC06753]